MCSVFQVSLPTPGNSSGRRSTNGAWRLKPAAAAPCRHGRRFLNLSPRMRPLARHKQPVKAQARTNMSFSSVCCCERLMWVDGGVCLQESGSQREDNMLAPRWCLSHQQSLGLLKWKLMDIHLGLFGSKILSLHISLFSKICCHGLTLCINTDLLSAQPMVGDLFLLIFPECTIVTITAHQPLTAHTLRS